LQWTYLIRSFFWRRVRLLLAPSGGWDTPAIPALSGDKQTSDEPVATGAFDPQETSKAGAAPIAHSDFARSKDVHNLLELIALPWIIPNYHTLTGTLHYAVPCYMLLASTNHSGSMITPDRPSVRHPVSSEE
jgi:hypothetical protein